MPASHAGNLDMIVKTKFSVSHDYSSFLQLLSVCHSMVEDLAIFTILHVMELRLIFSVVESRHFAKI